MRRGSLGYIVTPVAVLAVAFCFPPASSAQDGAPAPTAGNSANDKMLAAKPTPRLSDGHPDFSGVWGGPGGGDHDTVAPDGSIRLGGGGSAGLPASVDPDDKHAFLDYHDVNHTRRLAAPNQPPYKPELAAKVKDLDYNANFQDPAFFCKPPGIPRSGFPAQIFQRPGAVVFLYAPLQGNFFKVIPTDGRPHDDLNLDTYNGDSVAHWDGDTLVVDSTNFNDDTWFSADGWFHSDALHVVEKFRREGDLIHYDVTVEDPKVFTRPWVMTPRIMRPYNHKQVSALDLLEENPPCHDREEEHLKAVEGHEH